MKIPPWRRLFRNSFRDRLEEEATREEVTFHLDELARRYEAEGTPPEQARRDALRRFGDPERWTDETIVASHARERAKMRREGFATFRGDLTIGLRQITRRPVSSALVLLVMALGVASGTTVWAVADAVLYRPLPIPEADRMVAMFGSNRRAPTFWISRHSYNAWSGGQRSFDHIAATRSGTLTLLEPFPDRVGFLGVESTFFDLIGTEPVLGRRLLPEDDASGAPRVLILTHALWNGRFGGDPDIVGREIRTQGGRVTVVGVMPKTFSWEEQQWDGPHAEGAERHLIMNGVFGTDDGSALGAGRLLTVARMAPGVTREAAQVDLDRVGRAVIAEYPEYADWGGMGPFTPNVVPLRWTLTRMVADQVLLLGGAVLLLLLLVAVNVGGLLASRILDRQGELAVRASLGASRGGLVRQVLTETGILWGIALALGLSAAVGLVPLVRSLLPPGMPLLGDIQLHPRVILGALGGAMLLWILSGIVPGIEGTRVDLRSAAKGAGRVLGRNRRRVQRTLIVAQVAMACALLSGAGLLIRSYASLVNVDPGFDPSNVATLRLRLPVSMVEQVGTMGDIGGPALEGYRRYFDDSDPLLTPGPEFYDFLAGTMERMAAVPGVESVTFANRGPLDAETNWNPAQLPDESGAPDESKPPIRFKWVSPNYFASLGIPILRGRPLLDSDRRQDLPVMVVNEPFVERILDVDDPLGHSVELFFPPWVPSTEWTVVGVVPPTIQAGPHRPEEIIIYVPMEQIRLYWTADQIGYTRNLTFMAPYQQGARADVVFQGLREAIWANEPTLPIVRAARLEDVQAELVAQPRFFAVLMGSFASVALLLAALAVLASLAQHVRQRTREFGLRKALGADARDIVGKTLADGALLALLGVAFGAVLSWFGSRLLAAQVVGVQGWSPAIQIGVALVLVLTAVMASLAPALRASRIDPMEALRHE